MDTRADGLVMLGESAVGECVDGVCAIPGVDDVAVKGADAQRTAGDE